MSSIADSTSLKDRDRTLLREEALKQVDALCDAKSVLNHPFYVAWQRGELTQEALAEYAAQYYHHISAFPTYISALHSRTQDFNMRQTLLRNLMEEEMGEDNHPELWLRFAEGVGAARETVFATEPAAQAQELVATFRHLAQERGPAAGFAALYAYERQTPAVSRTKIEGLCRFYGITDERTLGYFRVHEEIDIRHAEEARQLLAQSIQTEAAAADAIAGASQIADALWNLLTEIGRRHNIASCAA